METYMKYTEKPKINRKIKILNNLKSWYDIEIN